MWDGKIEEEKLFTTSPMVFKCIKFLLYRELTVNFILNFDIFRIFMKVRFKYLSFMKKFMVQWQTLLIELQTNKEIKLIDQN